MKELILQPFLDACDFPDDMEEELASNEVSTHYQCDILYVDWKDNEYFLISKQWLIETYGEIVKKYNKFGIQAT